MHKMKPYFPSHYKLGYLALARDYYSEVCNRLVRLIASGGTTRAINAYVDGMGEVAEICLYNLRQMEDLNDGEGRLTQEEYDNLYNEIIDPITISGLTEAKVQLVDFQRKLNEAEAACREEEGYLSFLYGE